MLALQKNRHTMCVCVTAELFVIVIDIKVNVVSQVAFGSTYRRFVNRS